MIVMSLLMVAQSPIELVPDRTIAIKKLIMSMFYTIPLASTIKDALPWSKVHSAQQES